MPDEMTVTQALQFLEADRARRVAELSQELGRLLDLYNCELVAQPMLTPDGRLGATINIVAK